MSRYPITCPNCGELVTRAGGLTSHLATFDCWAAGEHNKGNTVIAEGHKNPLIFDPLPLKYTFFEENRNFKKTVLTGINLERSAFDWKQSICIFPSSERVVLTGIRALAKQGESRIHSTFRALLGQDFRKYPNRIEAAFFHINMLRVLHDQCVRTNGERVINQELVDHLQLLMELQ